MHWRRKWQPTPVFLPGESQGREAWWAAVYGVAQSRTRLKRLSSSSSSSSLSDVSSRHFPAVSTSLFSMFVSLFLPCKLVHQYHRPRFHKVKVKVKSLSRIQLFATLWTVAYQASLSMGFSRQEYLSGLPFPSPGDLPDPGMEAGLLNCRQILYLLSYQRRKVGLDTMTYPKILLLHSALACASLTGFLVLCIKSN